MTATVYITLLSMFSVCQTRYTSRKAIYTNHKNLPRQHKETIIKKIKQHLNYFMLHFA